MVVLGVLALFVVVFGLHMTGLWKAWPISRRGSARSASHWASLPFAARVFFVACLAIGLAAGVLLASAAHR